MKRNVADRRTDVINDFKCWYKQEYGRGLDL